MGNYIKRPLALMLAVLLSLSVCVQGAAALEDTGDAAEAGENASAVLDEGQTPEGEADPADDTPEEEIPAVAEGELGESSDPAPEAQQPEDTPAQAEPSLGISYAVVLFPQVTTPGVQQILVGIGDEDSTVDSAVLTVRSETTGETADYTATTLTAGAALFEIDYAAGQTGAYTVESIRFSADGAEQSYSFADLGMDARYGVNQAVETAPDDVVVDEDTAAGTDSDISVDFSVSAVDENGNLQTADSIESALNLASDDGIATMSLEDEITTYAAQSGGNLVVVLDPGHGAYKTQSNLTNGYLDHGASFTYNGVTYYEKDLNLKIAQYCKAELEQYSGVTVYLTRNGDLTGKVTTNQDRVNIANSYAADIMVSIHLNSATDAGQPEGSATTATGSEVFYPNANGTNGAVSVEAAKAAQSILDQLVALGLRERGIKIWNAEEDKYEDGTPMDYLGINRYSKELGFVGILVEHCFLNNVSELTTYLASETGLQKLGIADATGIANYLGLTKDPMDLTNASISASVNTARSQISTTLAGVTGGVKNVQFYVWSTENGQDDLRTYDGVLQSDGSWSATVPLSDYSTYGTYAIHCYAQDSSGWKFARAASVEVNKITATATATVTDAATGAFRVDVTDLNYPDAVQKMRVAVWSDANGQDDLIWTDATKSGNSWTINVDTYDHNYDGGSYNIHVYVQDPWGSWYAARCITHSVTVSGGTPTLSAEWDSAQGNLNLTLSGYLTGKNMTGISFPVWSTENGQDDLVWYAATRQSNGDWTATVPLKNHATYGTYAIHCYASTTGGSQFVTATSATVDTVTATATATTTSAATGAFRVDVTDLNAPNAVTEMRIAVWSAVNGQDDLIWTTATKNGNSWYINVDTYDHNYDEGTYNIHVYVRDTMGGWYAARCMSCTVDVGEDNRALSADWDVENGQLLLTLSGYLAGKTVTGISFPVWSTENGQDDLVWYAATRQSNGDWTATVPLKNHATYGTYAIHCYASTTSGSQFVTATSATVDQVTATATATTTSAATGAFRVDVTDLNVPNAVTEMRIAVWSAVNGQDDLIWTTATKNGNSWTINVDTYDHNYDEGTYNIHIYVRDTMGGWYAARAFTCAVDLQGVEKKLTADWHVEGGGLNLSLSGYLVGKSVTGMRFAVWSEENGQDDLIWYSGTRQSDGTWTASVPLTRHSGYGTYYVHCYRETAAGLQFVDAVSAQVSRVAATVSTINTDSITGSFRVNLTQVNFPEAVTEVRVAAWSNINGQDDLIWTTATADGANWYADINTPDHHYDDGAYTVHVYVRDTMGGWYAISALQYTVEVHQDEAALTVVMNSNTDYLNITLTGAVLNSSVATVKFAVWSSNNGQDDLRWYTAAYSAGNWSFTVPLANHGYDTGLYYVHCYYNTGYGDRALRTATITPYTGARPAASATAQTIWNFFRGKGLSESGTAALLGNLYAESALNSGNLQNSYNNSLGYTDAAYTAAVDDGSYRYAGYENARDSFTRDSGGYGLAQWTYWSRKQALYDFAKAQGASIGDLNMQLNYLWQELNASYPTLVSALRSADSVKTASDLVLTQFERPADQSATVMEKRANYGRAYYGCYA